MKFKFIFIIIIALVLIGFVSYKNQKSSETENNSSSTENLSSGETDLKPVLGNHAVDSAVRDFLISQEEFAWTTAENSKHICVFQNLDASRNLFPYYIWVRCGEFAVVDGKIQEMSGISIPAKIDYPNELSFFDLKKFTFEIPRDGSLYMEDINIIFPEYMRNNLNFDSSRVNKAIKIEAEKYFGVE